VRDTAAFLDAVGGADPADIYHLPLPDVPYATTMSELPDGLRIGYIESVEATEVTVDADCVVAVTETAGLLEALGHHVEPGGPARLFDEDFATHQLRSVLNGLEIEVCIPARVGNEHSYGPTAADKAIRKGPLCVSMTL